MCARARPMMGHCCARREMDTAQLGSVTVRATWGHCRAYWSSTLVAIVCVCVSVSLRAMVRTLLTLHTELELRRPTVFEHVGGYYELYMIMGEW